MSPKYSAFGTQLWIGDLGQAFTAAAATDILTANAHGFSSADPVMVQGLSLPTGIVAQTVYYARDITANTFKLAATAGGAAINLTADGSGTVRKLATIAYVRSIGGPTLSLDTLDVTTHDSANAAREFLAGLIDTGEIPLELVFDYDAASHIALLTDLAARDNSQVFALRFPDLVLTTWGFTGIVEKFQPNAPSDGDLTASAGIKLTGAGRLP